MIEPRTDGDVGTISPIALFSRLSDALILAVEKDAKVKWIASYAENGQERKAFLVSIAKMDETIQAIVFALEMSVYRLLDRCDRRIAVTVLALLETAKNDRDGYAAHWRREKPWFVANGFIEQDLPTSPGSTVLAIQRLGEELFGSSVDSDLEKWADDIATMREMQANGKNTKDRFIKAVKQRERDNPDKYAKAETLLENRLRTTNQMSIGED